MLFILLLFVLLFKMNHSVLLTPEVVVIDSGENNSKLISEFSLKYTLSGGDTILSHGNIGQVNINAPFSSEVM